MKYKDLIQFESVDEIIKFDKLGDEDYRERLVKTFVFSNSFENFIIPRICRELDLDSVQETKGLQVVGFLLKVLMENQGHVLGRQRLLDLVWGADFIGSDRVVDSHIKKLRKSLGEYGDAIKTVIGGGYKIVP